MQGNKTKRIEVRAIGKPNIGALSESEHKVFYTALFKRITELAAKGVNEYEFNRRKGLL